MLELIISFLKYTGIRPETFGRLVLNDHNLVAKLQEGMQLTNEAEEAILSFMNRYEDAKE
jgi:hypothetical protein